MVVVVKQAEQIGDAEAFLRVDGGSIKRAVKRYPLLAFAGITFLLSWGTWMTGSSKGALMVGAFAPGLAAVAVVAWSEGIAGLQRLFERFLIWRVHPICYAAAFVLPAAVSLLATAVHMMFGGDAPDFRAPPITTVALPSYLQGWSPVALILPLFLQHVLYGTAISEELGWRGVALPRLQQRFNSFVASLLLGCFWAVWILPFYWKQGWIGGNERAFVLLAFVPGVVLATWIYNISGGSLLLCVIFNLALKITDLVLASPGAHPLVAVCAYWMVAGLVLSFTGVELGARRAVAAPKEQVPALASERVTGL